MKKKVIHILFYFLYFCAILISIMLFNWGSLPKAQDDSQTINQAIDLAISNHESDPTAHMGSGESIDIHRVNTVIDHPAQSIVPDKLFGGDIVIKTQFEALTPWALVGDVSIADWQGLAVTVEWGVENTSKVTSAIYQNGYMFDENFDMYFETQGIWKTTKTHLGAWFGFLTSESSSADGFGFQVREGVLYAHVGYHSTYTNTSLSSINVAQSHFYQCLYNTTTKEIIFKVDGSVVATISISKTGFWQDDRTPSFGVHVTVSNDGTFYFQYLYAWRKLLTS